MMSRPSSPLKKGKVKNFFGKKNKNKESSPGSTNSDNVSYTALHDTPILSNSAKKLDKNGSEFPTIPHLVSDEDDNLNNSYDDESVAAMSDIRERETSLGSHSWNDLENDEEYYKQDYYVNTSAGEKLTVSADVGEADSEYNISVDVEEETCDEGNNGNIVDNTATPRRDNKKSSTTAAVESSISSPVTPTNTPGSKVSFYTDEITTQTPPSLFHKIDAVATTPNSTDESVPVTPLEEMNTPGGSTNGPKVLKQNKKLRAGRKELLKIIGSTNKQFREYEVVASRKILELEERIRSMEKEQQKNDAVIEDGEEKSDVAALAMGNGVAAAVVSDTPHATFVEDKSNEKSGSNETKMVSLEERSDKSSTSPGAVRNLSKELMEQEQQNSSKGKLISSLQVRCKTLQHKLSKTQNELDEKRKVWEDEVDMLSDALEKNNEALDYSVTQLERLRKWKMEQDLKEEELCLEEKTRKDEEGGKGLDEQESDLKMKSAMKEMELTMTEKEHQIERLEGNIKEKELDIVQLQTDLDSCFKEIETLKELVNKTAAAKGYEDFQDIVENVRDEATRSESKATAFNERISELESELQLKNDEIVQLKMSIEEGQKSFAEMGESDIEASTPTTDHPDQCNLGVDGKNNQDSSEHSNNSNEPIDNIKSILALSAANDPGISSPRSSSPGASSTDSRRWSLSFARKLAKEGRQYAAAVGNANDPDSMVGMIRERDRKISSLEVTIKTNTLMIEKLKKDVERMDTEHEEALLHSSQTIKQLEEENAVYLQQVKGFEKAFMTLNESQQTTILPSLDEPEGSVASDKDDDEEVASKEEDPEDLTSQNAKLERMLTQLQVENSFQEDQIEKLKTELITLRVVSQQEQESACDKLRDDNKIMEAQRTALENQLVEINESAAMLRKSLAQDSTSDAQNQNAVEAGSNPILVAQVVMLENANKVLESSVDSLRSDQQEKLAPLLQRIALLEEEKRIMEEETLTKIQCREQTISNLEDSLKQATQSRLTKKKRNSALKLSQQLRARATKAISD
eukprot:CAMPEP_0201695432 /NCGR_PEP_ID=MMETSP0578-20130828/7380_1 /ASSEMBLY_ACC=CAM_ASM_000663 /TAXON_ID=267565 /ORGANISM="Skeletonema grethea, Strain CCMP 1804" /LENGTH=1030 /DNA_ID=CAMNT_0048181277 /DNA_START=216 /DNA_END=3308 /DNA_ORIENTATION=-